MSRRADSERLQDIQEAMQRIRTYAADDEEVAADL
jgi:uncharacterized protein with HEPN domain